MSDEKCCVRDDAGLTPASRRKMMVALNQHLPNLELPVLESEEAVRAVPLAAEGLHPHGLEKGLHPHGLEKGLHPHCMALLLLPQVVSIFSFFSFLSFQRLPPPVPSLCLLSIFSSFLSLQRRLPLPVVGPPLSRI